MPLLEKERDVEPIKNGDRMTRDEFIRRAEGVPRLKLAELIGGRVYIMSPVSLAHSKLDGIIQVCLGLYAYQTPGCEYGPNSTCFMGEDEAPQPDSHLRISEECGGTSRAGEHGYLEGPPELIAEVSKSSSKHDLIDKFKIYETEGVQEYLVIIEQKNEIRWHRLNKGEYELVHLADDGVHRSAVFPGLWIDVRAFAERNPQKVMATLNAGINSPAHAKFVRHLAAKIRALKRGR